MNSKYFLLIPILGIFLTLYFDIRGLLINWIFYTGIFIQSISIILLFIFLLT